MKAIQFDDADNRNILFDIQALGRSARALLEGDEIDEGAYSTQSGQ